MAEWAINHLRSFVQVHNSFETTKSMQNFVFRCLVASDFPTAHKRGLFSILPPNPDGTVTICLSDTHTLDATSFDEAPPQILQFVHNCYALINDLAKNRNEPICNYLRSVFQISTMRTYILQGALSAQGNLIALYTNLYLNVNPYFTRPLPQLIFFKRGSHLLYDFPQPPELWSEMFHFSLKVLDKPYNDNKFDQFAQL